MPKVILYPLIGFVAGCIIVGVTGTLAIGFCKVFTMLLPKEEE
jgi:hypothetical protein